jgi:serine/threonine-protein kinase
LAAIHGQGIPHGDVKPANLLLSPGNSITLVDLGVNHLQRPTSSKSSGILLGAPQWLAPEQINGAASGVRSDLFSLSSILYLLLTGQHPFPAENQTQQLFSIVNREPAPLREINPKFPQQIEEICCKGLRKDADERFQSADEYAAALSEVLAGLT